MMLLTVVLAPLSIAVLFIVMSWTERALDHPLTRRGTEAKVRGGSPGYPPAERSDGRRA